jgi:hypothetical protein
MTKLINWIWLEDLLTQAVEAEIRALAMHTDAAFYAFCLEFDTVEASFQLSFGTRADVDQAAAAWDGPGDDPPCYRALELNPQHWRFRHQPFQNPDGPWAQAQPILASIRESITDEEAEGQVVEFLWLRFEYLVESLVQRLIEHEAFQPLHRASEFIAFAANAHDQLEELEDRLCKLYPHYNRATAEWAEHSRHSDVQAELQDLFEGEAEPASGEVRRRSLRRRACQSGKCSRHPSPRNTQRCTYCQRWFCDHCREGHQHPELASPQPLFAH